MTDITVVDVTQGLQVQVEETSSQTVAVETETSIEVHVETSTRAVTVAAEPVIELKVATAGIQGPPGPQGPSGAPGGSRYNHAQAAPAAVWSVQHNLGYQPIFTTVNIDGVDVTDGSDIFHIDDNNLTISFSTPVAGKAAFI